ncbi:MAG: hypothetical protein GX897_10365 [Clostridiales bacterium]|nr:hypothetical protein [Clostridiales bacterium]
MKKALLSLILLLFLLSGCGNLIKISYIDGKYIDKKNNISYIPATVSYEPVSVGDEYAIYDKRVLYTIPGMDPKQWLTEEFEGIGSLYYSDTITPPKLEDFGANLIYICIEDNIIMKVNEINDQEKVTDIVNAFISGEEAELPPDGSNVYHLKFLSPDWPSLYYDILYVEYDSEHNYLYDRGTKHCVDIGRLLKDVLPSDEDIQTEGGALLNA